MATDDHPLAGSLADRSRLGLVLVAVGAVTARYLIGDVLEVLPTLEESSVDLILTSPPFLALRSYLPADHPDKAKEGGSQSTPGEFIDWLIDVVEALDRVLAPHGSMCIELGDTYAGSGGAGGDYNEDGLREGQPAYKGSTARKTDRVTLADGRTIQSAGISNGQPRKGSGWPADKSLSLIPELFRLSLVYGFNPLTQRTTKPWRLRNVVRWVRPNPPVGALGDKFRPATSELMVFCRTDEAGRRRYFDLDAVREPFAEATIQRTKPGSALQSIGGAWDNSRPPALIAARMTQPGAPPLDWWEIPLLEGEEPKPYGPGDTPKPHRRNAKGVDSRPNTLPSGKRGGNWSTLPITDDAHPLGSPPLDWWEIPPGGYSGAHYAVFPEALCVKPIKAMCPEKVCRTCGEPSRRIVESEQFYRSTGEPTRGKRAFTTGAALNAGLEDKQHGVLRPLGHDSSVERRVLAESWSDCGHDNYRPGCVLDPFAGSGTTLAVAVGHGRDAIGIDLDSRNARLAEERIGFFLEVVA